MKLKRFLSLFLAISMLFSLLPITAYAEDAGEGGEIPEQISDVTEENENQEEEPSAPALWEETITQEMLSESVAVENAEQLQEAFQAGTTCIRLTQSIVVDRTFYVTANTVLFSTEPVSVTRADDFAADIFVVGETESGALAEGEITFVLGNPNINDSDLLVIDGNADNMQVDVTGTVLLVRENASVVTYGGTTVRNNRKKGNEKTFTEGYMLSYPEQVGAAAAIIAGGAMRIYGGSFVNNVVNDYSSDSKVSSHGGAIYNYGTLKIFDGTFAENHATRGGAIFNYRDAYIYGGTFSKNTSSDMGGAIYMANSTAASLHIGKETENTEEILFAENHAAAAGGAVLVQEVNTFEMHKGTFRGNISDTSGGAVYCYGNASVSNAVFENNSAATAGAMVINGKAVTFDNCHFTGNTSTGEAGAVQIEKESTVTMQNSTFTANRAGTHGGAMAVRSAKAELTSCVIKQNTCVNNGGAVYVSYRSDSDHDTDLLIVDSCLDENTASGNGGAMYATVHCSDSGVRNVQLRNTRLSENTSTGSGGAVYLTAGTNVYVYRGYFLNNHSNNTSGGGGAAYITGSSLEFNQGTVSGNTAGGNGGAMALFSSSKLIVNDVEISDNTAAVAGGALYNKASVLNVYDSKINGNKATSQSGANTYGGAVYLTTGANTGIYNSSFKNNISGTQAGAIYISTGNTCSTVIHSTEFEGNSAATLGGVTYITGSSQVEMYNITARNNSAANGGFMDETTTGTVVTLNGLNVSGNTATAGGPVIWGNSTGAKLKINKLNCTDLDYGAIDADYWKYAIVNKLTVEEISGKIPDYDPYKDGEDPDSDFDPDQFVELTENVTDVDELAKALSNGLPRIQLMNDIEINRTLYVPHNAVVFATSNVTLKRAADFDGDLFVVGEDRQGNSCAAHFELGDSINSDNALITVDGNKAALTDDVMGTAVFVAKEGVADLYDVALVNHLKVGNSRTMNEKYGLSYPLRIGGAAAIVAGGELNAYRASFTGNETLDMTDPSTEGGMTSSQGGALYNFGTVNIYGGEFTENHAARGGAIYNYRTLNIYAGTISKNTSSDMGGAIYMANSVNANITVSATDAPVVFSENHSGKVGGAIAEQANNTAYIDGAQFVKNVSDTDGGAICAYGSIEVRNSLFEDNTATARAAAVASAKSGRFTNVIFKNNNAGSESGALYADTESEMVLDGCTFQGNTAVTNGGAVALRSAVLDINETVFDGNTASNNGGTIYISYTGSSAVNSVVNINDSVITGSIGKNGGAIYATAHATESLDDVLTMHFSRIENSSNSTGSGGALYLTGGASAYLYKSDIVNNTSIGNSAVYVANASCLEINGGSITDNKAENIGGAIYVATGGKAIVNQADISRNTTQKSAGAIYNAGVFIAYDTTFADNTAVSNGGGIYLASGALTNLYSCTFDNNSAGTNAGAVYMATDTGSTLIHSTTFKNNKAGSLGGAIYATGKSQVELYNIIALNNSADKGGFMDETTTGTVVTLNGLTVSGNTATAGGPIIWGNSTGAKLRINKANYTDLDVSGNLDADYWKTAIVNNLTVEEISGAIPEYTPYNHDTVSILERSYDVKSAEELEAAIAAKRPLIRIASDFEIDRTFYITGNTLIFASATHKLTRAADFADEIFVVGEEAGGKNSENAAVLTLGNPDDKASNLLIIDGNRVNMNVPVTGSALFVAGNSEVNTYSSVTFTNHHKTDNVRAYDSKYAFGTPDYIGGAAALVVSGVMNVYGGKFEKNSVTGWDGDTTGRKSLYGGAIVNNSNLNIYGGSFVSNGATNGGAIADYGITKIYGGSFTGNYASKTGGAIYLVNSQYAEVLIGMESEHSSGKVRFSDNVSESHGGAINVHNNSTLVVYGNTVFSGNASNKASGGAISAYGSATVFDSSFTNNRAYQYGGAMYITNNNDAKTTRIVSVTDSKFTGNMSRHGGAIAVYAASDEYEEGGKLKLESCTFTENKAYDTTGKREISDATGGALFISRKGSTELVDCTFSDNTADYEGGAITVSTGSTLGVEHSSFIGNRCLQGNSGAISVHSGCIELTDTTFIGNAAAKNGGALYISYTSASDVNSVVKMDSCTLKNNTAQSYGGAIYVTHHAVDEPETELTVRNTTFEGNNAFYNGGALYLTAGSKAYAYNVHFDNNVAQAKPNSSGSRYGGGAVYITGSELEVNSGSFTGNNSDNYGGAMAILNEGKVILNEVSFSGNDAANNVGGAIYASGSELTAYDSLFENNTAAKNGGAVSSRSSSVVKIYNTDFNANHTDSNGGAVDVYSNDGKTLMQDCRFNGNNAQGNGGAIYASNESALELYDTVASNNSAAKGGFLYETVTNTTVKLVGFTTDGNTSTEGVEGGNIIWGNSLGAELYINKNLYTDSAVAEKDDAYWQSAICNLLTVYEIDDTVPSYKAYENPEKSSEEQTEKDPVLVQPVFDLALNSDEGKISSAYSALPRLDNSSNFMSRGTTYFENINGGTVSVDSFVSHEGVASDNSTVGEGLLIYQAMLYKQAHPEAPVSIDVSAYRVSAYTAICLNRNSRYFGYARNITNADYDKYGFVRISYLLNVAASMGINVTLINQLDGYIPYSVDDRDLFNYMAQFEDAPCDPAYVSDGKIGDYMNYQFCYWTVGEGGKGGTDMMHTKLCAVSHYLDMNGVEHGNAVWTSSTNLDGINASGLNCNNKLQTATIVSDHEDLYRVSTNYLHLIAQYCGQEDVYRFRELVSNMNTEQIDLILAGKGDTIPEDQRIVYIGSENDDVFELYFAPLGGASRVWDEVYNPFCKYLREFSRSDDYVTLIWNNANYIKYPLLSEMEELISDTFHNNRNVNNKIYTALAEFDASVYKDLKVGEDIGYMSHGEKAFGGIHSKDLQLSYSLDGERKYVSILNSANMHGGSLAYQSNQILVIKENNCNEDSVFFTMADQTSTGIVEHTYGTEEKICQPEGNKEGYTYVECIYCGKIKETGVVHNPGEWVIDRPESDAEKGVKHRNCTNCGILMDVSEIERTGLENSINTTDLAGMLFDRNTSYKVPGLSAAPHTLEATVQLDKENDRGGVIIGNYTKGTEAQLNMEVYTSGQIRLYHRIDDKVYDTFFTTDIRSDDPVHIAVTIDNKVASLYLNGQFKETKKLKWEMPEVLTDFVVGGDNRSGNAQYFKGTIYSAALFSDVRTAEEIVTDAMLVPSNAEGLQFLKYFLRNRCPAGDGKGNHQAGEWTNDVSPTLDSCGSRHIACVNCGMLLEVSEIPPCKATGRGYDYTTTGTRFTADELYTVDRDFSTVPHTCEALIELPKNVKSRGGVVVGNYTGDAGDQINIEIYNNGQPRLYYKIGGSSYSYIFNADVRSDKPVYLAVTVDGTVASLYLDGELKESVNIPSVLPDDAEDYNIYIGGDGRIENSQYFKGTIYAVNLFSDVRTADEMSLDRKFVPQDTDALIYSEYFTGDAGEEQHTAGDWIVDLDATQSSMGVIHRECTDCGMVMSAKETAPIESCKSVSMLNGGKKFTQQSSIRLYDKIEGALRTIEATVRLPETYKGRGGVIVGNYTGGSEIQMNLEVYNEGQLRLYYKDGKTYNTIFTPDIRSDDPVHIAVTVDGKVASLYLNGQLKETAQLKWEMSSSLTDFVVGGDNRLDNTQRFKGTIYSVALFSDVRTAEEIAQDFVQEPINEDNLVYSSKLQAPRTVEATIQLSETITDRGGVVVGNYNKSAEGQVNLEIYNNGCPRLYCRQGSKTYDYIFNTDVRSADAIHLAITMGDEYVSLYVNGVLAEKMSKKGPYPDWTEGFIIGGDRRQNNEQYFKGEVYSVNMFSDVRTADEIKADRIWVSGNTPDLIGNARFILNECPVSPDGEHVCGDWIVDVEPTMYEKGFMHRECIACAKVLEYHEIMPECEHAKTVSYLGKGTEFTEGTSVETGALTASPVTYEFRLHLDRKFTARAGTLIGNYTGGSEDQFNLEVYNNGKPRIYTKVKGKAYTAQFSTDIRSAGVTAVAFVIEGTSAKLYLNGVLKETIKLSVAPSEISEGLRIGGDYRLNNEQYFKGEIYSVDIFETARTDEQIAVDAYYIGENTDGLVYSQTFFSEES